MISKKAQFLVAAGLFSGVVLAVGPQALDNWERNRQANSSESDGYRSNAAQKYLSNLFGDRTRTRIPVVKFADARISDSDQIGRWLRVHSGESPEEKAERLSTLVEGCLPVDNFGAPLDKDKFGELTVEEIHLLKQEIGCTSQRYTNGGIVLKR